MTYLIVGSMWLVCVVISFGISNALVNVPECPTTDREHTNLLVLSVLGPLWLVALLVILKIKGYRNTQLAETGLKFTR